MNLLHIYDDFLLSCMIYYLVCCVLFFTFSLVIVFKNEGSVWVEIPPVWLEFGGMLSGLYLDAAVNCCCWVWSLLGTQLELWKPLWVFYDIRQPAFDLWSCCKNLLGMTLFSKDLISAPKLSLNTVCDGVSQGVRVPNKRKRHLFHQEIWNNIFYSTGDVCGRWFTGIWSSNPSNGQVPFHNIDLN